MFQTTKDLFYAGSYFLNPGHANEMVNRTLNVELETWTTGGTQPIKGGSAVMFAADTILKAGGGTTHDETNHNPCAHGEVTNRAVKIRVSDTNPQWEELAPMNHQRNNFYLIALPDGKVMAVGGQRGVMEGNPCTVANSVLTPEIYDPGSNSWHVMNPHSVPRLYHSSAVLLWDGSVFVAGGSPMEGVSNADLRTFEIFQPPYFFKGQRPVITSVPAEVKIGKHFRVDTPDAADITRVRLVRPGAATHSFDQDQRMLDLQFTLNNNTNPPSLKVQAPADMNLAPLGYYWLFICRDHISSTGNEVGAIPSISATIRLVPLFYSLP